MSFLALPTFEQKLITDDITNKVWYFFFQGLWRGQPPSSEVVITATASPMTYVAPSRGFVVLSGGTVSAISFSRDGAVFYTSGQTAGSFPLSVGDSLRVTYTVVPTMTFFPQ